MKKLRPLSVIILTIVMLLSAATNVFAETIYYYYGYLYTYIDDNTVSLCGWNSDTTGLMVPGTINKRRVAEISDRAFKNNTDLTEVRFFQSADLERIGSFAFDGCTGVDGEISLPVSIKTIDTGAFQNCTSLDSFSFNSSTDEISNQCFMGCSSLSKVSLKEGLKSIGHLAFADCSSLKTIDIPGTVTSISNTAFKNDDLIIRSYHNSFSEQYARDNGFSFEYLDLLIGDANANGTVDVSDATYIQKYDLNFDGYDLDEYATACADVNRDGIVNIRDVTLIQMYVAGIITEF